MGSVVFGDRQRKLLTFGGWRLEILLTSSSTWDQDLFHHKHKQLADIKMAEVEELNWSLIALG